MLVRVLGIVIAAASLAVVILGWSAYRVYAGGRTFRDRTLRLAELKSVVELDGILTMSARLSAATGEPRWREQYDRGARRLTEMLKELATFAETEEARKAVERINAANNAIMAMEKKSLSLGKSPDAMAWVTSDDYQRAEIDYHAGVKSLLESLEADAQAQAEAGQGASRRLLGGAAVALLAALIALGSLVANLRRHIVERESAVATLQALLEERAELREKATTDALTAAWNRATILEILESEQKRAKVGRGALAVIMADLDHFKRINDTMGHPAGDVVLRECAARMKAAVRPSDAVGRYGGEEFLVVLPGSTVEAATRTAERIRQSIEAAPTSNGAKVTLSLGVAAGKGDLVTAADAALYRAKGAGRNQVAT